MGSLTYDFLTESFLFSDDLITEQFKTVSDSELERELRRYREFCLSRETELFSEIRSHPSDLNVFAGLERVSIEHLAQSALYLHQYAINDPLVSLASEKSEYSEAMRKLQGFQPESLDREDLVRRLMFLKQITPMVAAGFVKLLPASVAFEPPKELPLFASDNYFEDALPARLLAFFREHVQVESLRKDEQGWCRTGRLFPCRGIAIHFKGHSRNPAAIYNYLDITRMDKTEEEHTLSFAAEMPDTPPPIPVFESWVRQSVNRAAQGLYRQIFLEGMIASRCNALYSTSSPFVADVLQQVYLPEHSVPVHTANVFLKLELPFLRNLSIETLMKVRREEGEAFENFRIALEKQLRDLRTDEDANEVKLKAKNAVHELAEVQVREIQNRVATLKEKGWLSAGVGVTSLLTTVQTAGWSLLGVAGAALEGARLAVDYRENVKRHPAFFLWKLLNRKKR
jgi:hypothetical protein